MDNIQKLFRSSTWVVVFLALGAILYSVTKLSHPSISRFFQTTEYTITYKPPEDITVAIVQMRNSLSQQLNDMRRKLGQLQCEKSKGQVDKQGGWCKEASKEHSGEHRTDMKLIKALSKFWKGKRVGSFGDGPGAYKREILKLGEVKSYDAYDGAPYCEETSEGRVKFMDLTIPQFGIPLFDWILSLEVAEHIPNEFESIYLDNIFRHAKEGIILSWAVPGQGGLSHINNRPLSYVLDVMEKNGFHLEPDLSETLRNATSLSWLQQNVNVYVRDSFNKFENETILSQFFT